MDCQVLSSFLDDFLLHEVFYSCSSLDEANLFQFPFPDEHGNIVQRRLNFQALPSLIQLPVVYISEPAAGRKINLSAALLFLQDRAHQHIVPKENSSSTSQAVSSSGKL